MAEESFDVNVKDFQGGSVVIKVYPTWNVSTVKREIAARTNVDPQHFRIVFAGQSLSDNQTLWVSALTQVKHNYNSCFLEKAANWWKFI